MKGYRKQTQPRAAPGERGNAINIYFLPEVEQYLRQEAARQGISMSMLVNAALTEYRERRQRTEAGEPAEVP